MTRRLVPRALGWLVVSAFACVQGPTLASLEQADAGVIADDAIRRILADRVDERRQAVGIVAGVIDSNGRRVISYGAVAKGDPRRVDGDTVFEIGSITKAFTSLLLADMVRSRDVELTDPVAKYLPATIKVPQRDGRVITLQDLSTHTSGLPRLPTNLKPKDPLNPYADYTVEQLYEFLSSYELTRGIGERYEYSNLGGGLLGQALERRAGKDYEALVQERITGPLMMSDTRITLSDAMKERLAQGHNGRLEPAPNWDLPTLAGAGALRSTANDLLKLLAVPLGYAESPLAADFAAALAARRPTGFAGLEIGLGWLIRKTPRREIIWHNGGTGGYRTFAGYDLSARTGVVVLSNTFTLAGVDDIGFHLLDSEIPLLTGPKD
jgi:D-alanyl-D-alanine-carboxypeptidase/D-alanyl-D-alanine-endopeptidase